MLSCVKRLRCCPEYEIARDTQPAGKLNRPIDETWIYPIMFTKLHILLTIALFLACYACNQEPVDPQFEYNLKSARVIQTNNNFGLELMTSILQKETSPNILISPVSVSIALGMAYNGSETETREAFERVLDYEGLTRQEVNEITRELISVLTTNVEGNLLEIANSMWSDEGFPVNEDFVDLNVRYFGSEVREMDLHTAQALETINNWVSNQTNGKIKKIVEEIDPVTMMLLINALYFNCVWEVEFDPGDTREAPFFSGDDETRTIVDMMSLESTLNAAFTDDFRAVELPYKNKKFSMFLFLPAQGTTLNQLAEKLDGEQWEQWMEQFQEVSDFTIQMPKFRFEFERSLNDDLKAMGLGVALSASADFSGISPIPLFISNVIHKTYIEVNEEGTEAAAVTAVEMSLTSVDPSSFLRIDRPFLFAIRENSSRSIVFIGTVTEPLYEDL